MDYYKLNFTMYLAFVDAARDIYTWMEEKLSHAKSMIKQGGAIPMVKIRSVGSMMREGRLSGLYIPFLRPQCQAQHCSQIHFITQVGYIHQYQSILPLSMSIGLVGGR